jgi:hypothetical protein
VQRNTQQPAAQLGKGREALQALLASLGGSRKPDKMARMLYSPYGPRARRSPQVIILYMACFLLILFLTWYLTTRHPETARSYASEFLGKSPAAGKARLNADHAAE